MNEEDGLEKSEVLKIFEETGALLRGHFLLTSGLHSDTYFQCAKVLQFPGHSERLAREISAHFAQTGIDTVIAPAVGGIVVGQEVARQLGKRSIFAERENGRMSLRRGFSLESGERVLICEDVVTTGGSVFEVIELVKAQGAVPVGVGFIVDRSNGTVQFATDQLSVLQLPVTTYEPGDCPMCRQGSSPVKPGSRNLK